MRVLIFLLLIVKFTEVFSQATLTGKVMLKNSSETVPCNVMLKDSAGKPYWPDSNFVWVSFVNGVYPEFPCEGTFTIHQLPYGSYSYEIDHGPEFSMVTGSITVDKKNVELNVYLERLVNMEKKKWWSGETHIHRDLEDIPTLMKAADLHIGVVNTSWNIDNRASFSDDTLLRPIRVGTNIFYSVSGAEDERHGGSLLYLNSSKPIRFDIKDQEYPSMAEVMRKTLANYPGVWVDLEKPFWWDLPFFLSTGKINSVGIAHNHMNKRSMFDTEAMGRGRDRKDYPGPNGNAYWSQDVYYTILNAGFRIPPSAGSASGVLPTSVGYNRVYAYLENALDYEKWFEAMKLGRVFVTNGPLLDCRANGQLPGHVFKSKSKKLTIDLVSEIISRDTIEKIEIIKNGKVYASISGENMKGDSINTRISFEESGWFLLRVICKKYNTFRFASTAPYYVEMRDTRQRISKSAVQFFIDWANLRASKIDIKNPEMKKKVTEQIAVSMRYWNKLLKKSNAE